MSMYQAIKETDRQFGFKPKVENADKLVRVSKYVLVGMGGSGLAGRLLKMLNPDLDLVVHNGYGLPRLPDLKHRLIILSSYSGNTEEVLNAYQKAGELGLSRAIVATGGQLLEQAKKDKVVYIEMPDFKIQPRSALALSLMGLLKFTGDEDKLKAINELANNFHPLDMESGGKSLAERLKGYVPIVYTSDDNRALAYIWKITFNETGKIPAFYNVFPELNHNEMSGFSSIDAVGDLFSKFLFIFLEDDLDHPQIKKRMDITARLYTERGFKVERISLRGENIFRKVFNSVMLVDFTAYFLAEDYGLDSEQVPMVEELKRLISQ